MFSKAEQAFARLDRAAADIEAAAASARTAIDGDGRKTFADVSAAARDLREGIAEARVVIHRLADAARGLAAPERKNVVVGKGVGERVDRVCRRCITKKK